MKILLLGGIGESMSLAKELIQLNHEVVYSIAGLVRTPNLDCTIHSGGFSQYGQDSIHGLAVFLEQKNIDLVLDATHPYAETISNSAWMAAQKIQLPCWRYERPPWNLSDIQHFTEFHSLDQLWPLLKEYKTPFFTMGASILNHHFQIEPQQKWIVRSAKQENPVSGVEQIAAIGPFSLEEEINTIQDYTVDVLISKNSGGSKNFSKIIAAQKLDIPILVQSRPDLPRVHRIFDSIHDAKAAIASF